MKQTTKRLPSKTTMAVTPVPIRVSPPGPGLCGLENEAATAGTTASVVEADVVDVTGGVVEVLVVVVDVLVVLVVVVAAVVVVVVEVAPVVDVVVATVVVGPVVVVDEGEVPVVVAGDVTGGLVVALGAPVALVAGAGRVVADVPPATVGWLDPPLEPDGADEPVADASAACSCDWSTN